MHLHRVTGCIFILLYFWLQLAICRADSTSLTVGTVPIILTSGLLSEKLPFILQSNPTLPWSGGRSPAGSWLPGQRETLDPPEITNMSIEATGEARVSSSGLKPSRVNLHVIDIEPDTSGFVAVVLPTVPGKVLQHPEGAAVSPVPDSSKKIRVTFFPGVRYTSFDWVGIHGRWFRNHIWLKDDDEWPRGRVSLSGGVPEEEESFEIYSRDFREKEEEFSLVGQQSEQEAIARAQIKFDMILDWLLGDVVQLVDPAECANCPDNGQQAKNVVMSLRTEPMATGPTERHWHNWQIVSGAGNPTRQGRLAGNLNTQESLVTRNNDQQKRFAKQIGKSKAGYGRKVPKSKNRELPARPEPIGAESTEPAAAGLKPNYKERPGETSEKPGEPREKNGKLREKSQAQTESSETTSGITQAGHEVILELVTPEDRQLSEELMCIICYQVYQNIKTFNHMQAAAASDPRHICCSSCFKNLESLNKPGSDAGLEHRCPMCSEPINGIRNNHEMSAKAATLKTRCIFCSNLVSLGSFDQHLEKHLQPLPSHPADSVSTSDRSSLFEKHPELRQKKTTSYPSKKITMLEIVTSEGTIILKAISGDYVKVETSYEIPATADDNGLLHLYLTRGLSYLYIPNGYKGQINISTGSGNITGSFNGNSGGLLQTVSGTIDISHGIPGLVVFSELGKTKYSQTFYATKVTSENHGSLPVHFQQKVTEQQEWLMLKNTVPMSSESAMLRLCSKRGPIMIENERTSARPYLRTPSGAPDHHHL